MSKKRLVGWRIKEREAHERTIMLAARTLEKAELKGRWQLRQDVS